MAKRNDIKKILVIGSGPIIIGQAAEFDYAGTQACLALKEEGYQVVLINSNPATIMTDQTIADKVYMEPLTLTFVQQVIAQERPDALLPSLGGQTALNLAMELSRAGVLKKYQVEVIGTGLKSIEQAEDRLLFKNLMEAIAEPTIESTIVQKIAEACTFAEMIGYPVIVRPAFTMGGTGGGIAATQRELETIVALGLKASPTNQCLIEKSVAGFKEIEFEVMRDKKDNAIVICSMENFDPVGVHTGDSIVFAPAQTLNDAEYRMLRASALKIIRALEIEGGCNVQFALNTQSRTYYIIEVNPRVSRSSALASKATGYPIAKIAAKIAIGLTLDEMKNPVTQTSSACFEPSIDYVVCKFPRWPFDKFQSANRTLGTQMKATGEVMAIGRTLQASLLKAIASLELGVEGLHYPELTDETDEEIIDRLNLVDDLRVFTIAEALRRGVTQEVIQRKTNIDLYFIGKIASLVRVEQHLKKEQLTKDLLTYAKRQGFSNGYIARYADESVETIEALTKKYNIQFIYKMVDTCSAEFPSKTPYFYSTYGIENESVPSAKKKVVVLGSGPIRIGQGLEFDYATVHSILALKELGYEAIVINNNPETVSTDFSIADKLYFEPLTLEYVERILALEQPDGVIVQFGGQTAINLAATIENKGYRILGTKVSDLDRTENREKFEEQLEYLEIARPKGASVFSEDEAYRVAEQIGYPVVIRPSYVLGGRAMQIVYDAQQLSRYMKEAVKVHEKQPVLIDKYLIGKELEVDAICDGHTIFIPGIMEHIEKAGVHSGDSLAVYPPRTISQEIQKQIVRYTKKLALGFNIKGLLNIQFVLVAEKLYVLEINPRASRTIPFMSKVVHISLANLATKVIMGNTLQELGIKQEIAPVASGYFVKAPVFSFAKLRSVDITLGPEMKSTGEVIGKDLVYERALYKALIASGMKIPFLGTAVFTIADRDKAEALELAKRLQHIGYTLLATAGTAAYFKAHQVEVDIVAKMHHEINNILTFIEQGKINFVVNTISGEQSSANDGFFIRRHAVENNIACFTSLDTALATVEVLEMLNFEVQPFDNDKIEVCI